MNDCLFGILYNVKFVHVLEFVVIIRQVVIVLIVYRHRVFCKQLWVAMVRSLSIAFDQLQWDDMEHNFDDKSR